MKEYILSNETSAWSPYISKVFSAEEAELVRVVDRDKVPYLMGPEHLIKKVNESVSEDIKFKITHL